MTIDLLIVSDEKDDMKRYIDPIEQAFRHVKKSIDVERTITRYVGKDNIPKAKRILLLLHGNRERAERVCKSFMNCLDKPRNAGKQMFAITVTERADTISAENTPSNDEPSADQNVLVLEDVDSIEAWVPQLIRKFFVIDIEDKRKNVNIQNISPEYTIAKQTANSIRTICSHFGFSFTSHADSNVCFVVARSSMVHDGCKNLQIHTVERESRASDIEMFCVSTTNRSTAGNADVYQLPVYGRPDIVTCIVVALFHLNIIPGSRLKRALSKCYTYTICCIKATLSCVVLLMHLVFALSLIPLMFILLGCGTLKLLCRSENFEEVAMVFNTVTNCILTAIWIGLIWGLDLGKDPAINVVATLIVIVFYIVWYTLVHIFVFKIYLKYEYGFYDLPWVWWE